MPRRRGYYSRGSAVKKDVAQFEELDRAEFLDLVLVAYAVSDGDKADIATHIERRLAIFRKEGFPEDVYPSKSDDTYGYFDGLPQAEIDEPLDTIKERDAEALQHREESTRLMKNSDDPYHRMVDKVSFSDFLSAVNRVKDNDNDEEAWAIIDTWRTRRMKNERVI